GNSLAISPTTTLQVAGDRMGTGPEIWDVAQEKVKQVIPAHDFRVFSLKFSPNGHLLAMGGEKSAILWDLVENSKRFEFEGSWIIRTLTRTQRNVEGLPHSGFVQ